MKRLGTRVNLIPVIAKADTLTQNDLYTFKQRIRQVIQAQGIRIYQPPIELDDEVSAEHARVLSEAMPFSIIGSTEDVTTPDGRTVKGREYLWGVAEVENENHCDFRKLRSLLIRTYMLDLISSTEELHYENYRQAQMETRKFGEQKPRKFENPKFKEEEEALRKRFTEQVKAEEARFRQWEQHVRICRCCDGVHARTDIFTSSLRSATGSTRTSRWPTARSRRSRPSSTTFRSATAAAPAGGEECVVVVSSLSPFFPTHCAKTLAPVFCAPSLVFLCSCSLPLRYPSDRDPLVTYSISPLLVVFSLSLSSAARSCAVVSLQSVLATLLAAAHQLGTRVASNGYLVARFGFGFGFGFWLLVQTQTQIQTVACGRT